MTEENNTGQALEELAKSMESMNQYVEYIIKIESDFYRDDETNALLLAKEAKEKGHSHSMFDYVIGFCYLNGKGGVFENKDRAGKAFFLSAEEKDAKGEYVNEKHANESRAILVQDYVVHGNQFRIIDADKAIEYCSCLINYEHRLDNSLLYMAILYSRPHYGHVDKDKAIEFCNRVLSTSEDQDLKQRASDLKQEVTRLKFYGAKTDEHTDKNVLEKGLAFIAIIISVFVIWMTLKG